MPHTVVVPGFVRHLPLFSGLTEKDRDVLLQEGRIRYCKRGQVLFHHADPVTHFYILISGIIQLCRESAEGKEKTVDVLKAGWTLCESEIMDSCKGHRASAIAVDDMTVMEFPVAWLKTTAQQYPVFALNLLSLIAQHAHLAEVEAEHQASMSAAQLVACFLQRMCVLYDFNPSGFELPYNKTLIASRLGMELETFSRTLVKLKDHGITVKGNRVEIHDLQAIEHYVCNFCSISGECNTHRAMERKQQGLPTGKAFSKC